MNTIKRLRRGWLTYAAVGALALLLAACGTELPPRAETESLTDDTAAPADSPPAGGEQPTDQPTDQGQPAEDTPAAGGEQPASDPAGEAGAGEPAAGGDGSSRESPAPPGQLLQVGEWAVAVQPTNTDAAQIVLAENQFNSAPPDGHVFVLARVDVRYDGEGSGQAWIELDFQALAPDGNTYGDDCGVIPNELFNVGEMFTGAAASGNICAVVPTSQVEGAMWVVDERISFTDDSRVFVAFQ